MRQSVKRSAPESDRLSPSFAKVSDKGNNPLWYIAQLSFTFTVSLLIEVLSGIFILVLPRFFKDIYCTEGIHSVYKDKLQNCSCNQFE
jgi:hypothetical protein